MRTNKDYLFPLPVSDNQTEFLDAIKDVVTAAVQRKGIVKDYSEQKLPGGGMTGTIAMEEDV